MDTRPSRDIDARARDRAAKRYRQVGDDWVKVKKVKGAWVLDATSKKFASLDEAVVHEMALTQHLVVVKSVGADTRAAFQLFFLSWLSGGLALWAYKGPNL